jgi:hypothetical protein
MENEQEIENTEGITKKKSLVKKIFSGIGIGGAVIGGGLLSLIFVVIRFLYIASAGLSMVWYAIILFQKGSIVWGLVVLIIGTPLAIGIASYLFLPLLLFSIVTLIIWGVASMFGIHTSFNNIWDLLWLGIKVLLVGGMAFFGVSEFVRSVKQKRVSGFFKENWFYFLIFLFLFWLFFINVNSNSTEVSQSDSNQATQVEPMNSSELDKFSAVLAKEEPLTDSDLENIRSALQSYTDRTGNYLTQNDVDGFTALIKQSNDYQYELGQSLLFSWDQHKIYTTSAFDKLYKEMEQANYRKPGALQFDKDRLKQAADNQSYSEDADGNRYEFGREVILQGIDKANIARKNMDKIILVFNEFVK